jgi:hypothetical protein
VLQFAILRAASLIVPDGQRALWLAEWQSEFWYIPPRQATPFCLGAFRDALWLRRNAPSPTHSSLESPLACLAFLSALAAASILIALRLPVPRTMPSHLGLRGVLEGSLEMFAFAIVLLPATRMVMGPPPPTARALSFAVRLRRALFLFLKVVALQPFFFGSLLANLAVSRTVPIAPNLIMFAFWAFAYHWLVADQRSRCPVCLRRLRATVRIGSPSQTFLEWYGAESLCSRGHGLLHTTEVSGSYSGNPQWLALGPSWSTLK